MADPALLVERVVEMPIVNPETKRASRSFIFMGKVDLVDPQERKLRDYKGTGDPQRFLRTLRIGYQAELYVLALAHTGITILEIEYCLVSRPTIKFIECQRTYAVMRAGRKTAVRRLNDKTEAENLAKLQGCSVEERTTGDVDRDAYEQRCVEWLQEHPERLTTYVYMISPAKLTQARWFLWEASKRVLDCRRFDRWIPNTGACHAYERECQFADLCEVAQCGGDWKWVIEDRYRVRNSSHPELKDADAGKSVLTYSSLSDLTRCEMYFFWKHEKCLTRTQGEDSEPLWLGSAMHVGLETYATAGVDVALAAVDAWADDNWVLGENADRKQEQQIARARAMVRMASTRWGTHGKGDPDKEAQR